MPLFGSHLSIAGDMTNALDEAAALKLDAVQVFTKNQQQWKVRPLKPDAVDRWRGRVAELGWQDRTVAHASYLINLASPDDTLWKKSIDLMEVEITRCAELGIPFLVHHPGAYTTSDLEAGLGRIASAYVELFDRTDGAPVVSCLENTAGGGSTIGGPFEHLAELRRLIVEEVGRARGERVGYCIDTCHAHAWGYDLSGEDKASAVMDDFVRTCGAEHLRVLHLNDSKGACGSRLDRHEHVGKGTIGAAGFRGVVNHAVARTVPAILETPKGETEAGTPFDTLNVRRLRKMVA